MYQIIKVFLFKIDPEKVHHFVMRSMKILCRLPGGKWMLKTFFGFENKALEKEVLGLKFINPVGLAAGFDKDGKYIDVLETLGFGFIEVGTITPKPQIGNPKPRLFRMPKDGALINRMGFNNEGVDLLAKRLQVYRQKYPNTKTIIGGNIGKNKNTPNANAVDDYIICFNKLHDFVDYFVVNVSSPNTPGLRELQEKKPLFNILNKLAKINDAYRNPKPILLKIAPDLTLGQLDDIVEIVLESGIAGVISSNTTIDRKGLNTPGEEVEKIGNGGLSGKPVNKKSDELLKNLVLKSKGKFAIIGVGGIHSGSDALRKMNIGADLVQIYTGFIFEGPSLIKRIKKATIR